MEDESSVFHSMCEQSGEMGELLRIAKEADAERAGHHHRQVRKQILRLLLQVSTSGTALHKVEGKPMYIE